MSKNYTNDINIHSNFVIGTMHLLFWILFHPTAWKLYISHIDSSLCANFSLYELTYVQWKNSNLRYLILRCCFIIPFIMNLLSSIILLCIGIEIPDLTTGFLVGFFAGITAIAAIGTSIGLASGVVAGLVGGTLLGAAISLSLFFQDFNLTKYHAILSSITVEMVASLAIGYTASSILVHSKSYSHSFGRQIGGVVIGIAVGAITGSFGRGVHAGLALSLLTPDIRGPIVGSIVGGGLALASAWRSRDYRRLPTLGLIWCIVGTTVGYLCGISIENKSYDVAQAMVLAASHGLLFSIATGVAAALVVSFSFLIPYIISERIGGSISGTIAGLMGSLGGLIFLVLSKDIPTVSVSIFILFFMLLGYKQVLIRNIILFPLFSAWNTLLYQIDLRYDHKSKSLLHYHSAFWDELQKFPLYGLDDHIVMISRQGSSDSHEAIEYLIEGNQKWAGQSAHITLNILKLENCRTIHEIAEKNTSNTFYSEDISSSLFSRFNQFSLDVKTALNFSNLYHQKLGIENVISNIDDLCIRLISSSNNYAQMFRRVGVQWREILSRYIEELDEETKIRGEIDNLYIVGLPITDQQGIFVGRADIGIWIEQLLLDRRSPPLLLYGQRRMGKTSLLYNLKRLLSSGIVPLFVDLQGPITNSKNNSGFLYNLSRKLLESAKNQGIISLPFLSRQDLSEDPFTVFDQWLDTVQTILSPKTILITLDEFETLNDMFEKQGLDVSPILGMLRHIIQHRHRFKILLCGSHTPDELEHWSSYLINIQVIHLGYLKQDEAIQLIEKPVSNYALQYEPDATQYILNLTHFHPFLIQLICSQIVSIKNEQELTYRKKVRIKDVQYAISRALQQGNFFFSDIRNRQVNDSGRNILKYIASYGENSFVGLSKLEKKFPCNLEENLGLLKRREIIESHYIENTGIVYNFQIELVRKWFSEH